MGAVCCVHDKEKDVLAKAGTGGFTGVIAWRDVKRSQRCQIGERGIGKNRVKLSRSMRVHFKRWFDATYDFRKEIAKGAC